MSSSRQLAEHGGRTDDPHNVTPGQAGADPAGTASSEVSAHEAKSGAHTPAQVGADPAGSAASAESAAKSHADTKASEAQAHAVQRSNHTGTQTLATISDAGTAASRDVGTGSGNLMEVGAFGLGSAGFNVPRLFDCNAVTATGFYQTDPSAANMPVSGSGYLQHYAWDGTTNYAMQHYFHASGGPLYIRRKDNGIWRDWEQVISAGENDFSSMPTVNGSPIVESDSNSDGEWTRWADGTQHVKGFRDFPSVPHTEAFGIAYRSFASGTVVDLPVAFFGGIHDFSSSVTVGGTSFDNLSTLGVQQIEHESVAQIRPCFTFTESGTSRVPLSFFCSGRYK